MGIDSNNSGTDDFINYNSKHTYLSIIDDSDTSNGTTDKDADIIRLAFMIVNI